MGIGRHRFFFIGDNFPRWKLFYRSSKISFLNYGSAAAGAAGICAVSEGVSFLGFGSPSREVLWV